MRFEVVVHVEFGVGGGGVEDADAEWHIGDNVALVFGCVDGAFACMWCFVLVGRLCVLMVCAARDLVVKTLIA